MTQVKFYRVENLPEVGEVGSLYFVYGSGGVQSLLYICVGTGLFELYTPDLYELENKMDALENKVEEVGNKIDNIQLPEIDTSELASKNLEQFFGITAATEFTPLTTEEITNEINTLWEGL